MLRPLILLACSLGTACAEDRLVVFRLVADPSGMVLGVDLDGKRLITLNPNAIESIEDIAEYVMDHENANRQLAPRRTDGSYDIFLVSGRRILVSKAEMKLDDIVHVIQTARQASQKPEAK